MFINDVEEMVLNTDHPVYKNGFRRFRLEYGGHAENCLFEGTVYIHKDTPDIYERVRLVCQVLGGKDLLDRKKELWYNQGYE